MWLKDPKTKQQSVSLTFVVISMAFCLIASILEMFNVVKTTSLAFEMFGASCGLYWGRRWSSSSGQSIENEDIK